MLRRRNGKEKNMGTYNVHGGHNGIVPGASKYLNEVTEDRAVKNKVISYLRAAGYTVYDCTDESGRTQNANLANIVKKCNTHSVDLDISIHLNSGRNDSKGDGKTGGVEVLCYDGGTKTIAKAIADAIHDEFGYTLRSDGTTPDGYAGVKIDKDLYVLRSTKAPAILIECCFVDDKDDAKVWNSDKCARAIVKGITGKSVSTASSGSSSADHGGTPGKYWATVQLYSPNQTDAQKWIVHKHSDGKYSIKNKACSLYLDVKSAKTSNETPIQVYSWNNTKAQRFELEIGGADGVGEETVIRSVLDRNMAVDVKGAGTANGTKIQLYKFNNSSAQKWNFIPAGGDDEYYIINSVSGKALDVKGGGK